MKLIVGLGNPGKEYELTRHNIGFMIIDAFIKSHNIEIKNQKFNGLYAKEKINGVDVLLVKPLSFMNLSGEVLIQFVNYYKINLEDILVISDDLDMEVGKIKLKGQGSSGGHNGLKNIELHLQTPNYKRLKIGISNNKTIDTKDYVLGKLTKEEQETIQNILPTTTKILDEFLTTSFDKIMSKYNDKR